MLAAPITNLLKAKTQFTWGNEEEQSFQNIKTALTNDPVLAHYNYKDPVILKTDASINGIAGILLQR